MDKLSIVGISFSTLIGTLTWEQTTPQTLYCDVSFEVDAAMIAQQDSIAQTIDYDAMTRAISRFVEEHHFQLIETLADRLAHYLLAHFPIPWISLTIHKPGALKQATDVMITVERRRPL